MFPVDPELWPRSKAELEPVGGKHFSRGLEEALFLNTFNQINMGNELQTGGNQPLVKSVLLKKVFPLIFLWSWRVSPSPHS